MNVINFVKSFFVKDLASILKVFDKIHADLEKYITQARSEIVAGEARLEVTKQSLDIAITAKTSLFPQTSLPNN